MHPKEVIQVNSILANRTLLCCALILFVAFYPLESGLPAARSYAMLLRWFKWYNF